MLGAGVFTRFQQAMKGSEVDAMLDSSAHSSWEFPGRRDRVATI